VYGAYNTYIKSGSELDALPYVGALSQYLVDIDLYGDKTDPSYGNNQSVDIFESGNAQLCSRGGTDVLEKRALRGDLVAVELVLFYSAIYPTDGASTDDLGDIQARLKKKQPLVVKQAIAKNRDFFEAHPIQWFDND
jgi:hypothetical protein